MEAVPFSLMPEMVAKPASPRMVARDKGSFADYLDRKMDAGQGKGKNLLGAGRSVSQAAAPARSRNGSRANGGGEKAASDSLPALFARFLDELKDQAEARNLGPGQWQVSVADANRLEKIGQEAGMSGQELGRLLKGLEKQEGQLSLAPFLAQLSQHFQQLAKPQPVTVAETELPLLAIVLERLGVPVEQVAALGEQAVTGDGRLDLSAFLAGLEDVSGQKLTTLSEVEGEQLQELLAQAGASRSLQRALLPERHSGWQNPAQAARPVQLGLERLKQMLAQTLAEHQQGQPQIEMPQLLQDLKGLFAEGVFKEQGVSWSPAVEKAFVSIYDKLMESVDLSRVRLEAKKDLAGFLVDAKTLEEGLAVDGEQEGVSSGTWADDGGRWNQLLERVTAGTGVFAAHHEDSPAEDGGLLPGSDQPVIKVEASALASHEAGNPFRPENLSQPRPLPHQPLLTPQQAQILVEQLAGAVGQGLHRDQHHLVLHLYPKELGEVKVEMVVRNDHVAVSFAMENSRVKDILENNMDMFRHNLEQQGFVLEGCNVSVGQHDGGESWQGFADSRPDRLWGGAAGIEAGESADAATYLATLRPWHPDQQISLLV